MATPRKISVLVLGGLLGAMVLSVATCRLDMLLKPGVEDRPVLNVAPREVTDSARAGSDDIRRIEVEITNAGSGSFTWSATKDKGWIGLSPESGNGPGLLNIALDAHGLAPATYEGVVTIHAPGAQDSVAQIAVKFHVQRAGLIVTPGALTHGANINSNAVFNDNLEIRNGGNGVLVWAVTKSKSWITLGAVAGIGNGTVPVTIRTTGLARGTYTDEIVITSPGAEGSPARIPVTRSIFEPGLAVSPTSVLDSSNVGGTALSTKTLSVGNSGGGTITWTATKSRPWVTLSAGAGAAPPASSMDVTLNPTGLALGTYRDTIVFRSPEATNDPVRIPVQLDIVRPVLAVKPAAIVDAAAPGDTTKRRHDLAITNSARGEFSWTASKDMAWISLSAEAGAEADTISVTLDPSGLAPGMHKGKIVVTSPGAQNSPETVDVTLSIDSPCRETPVMPDDVISSSLGGGDCFAPHRPGSRAELYTIAAVPGDMLSFRMTASFNAYLVLTDGAGVPLAQNDECPGESRTACIRNFSVTASGTYIVEATTTGPGEIGSYTLWVIRELPPPPPQGLAQFEQDGSPIAVGGTTPDEAVTFRGVISDPNDADTVRLEIELEPLGSPFTDIRTHQSAPVAASRGNVTVSLLAGDLLKTGYHWQARTCDRTGRCSAWLKYGGNAETAADFTVSSSSGPGGAPPISPEGGEGGTKP
jgi:hypothetical protein